MLNIDQFKSVFRNPARSNLFLVQLNFPSPISNDAKDVFYCHSASLPTRTVGVIDIGYMGRHIKFQGDSSYNEMTIGIYNDLDFTLRKKFEAWVELVNGAKDNLSAIDWGTIQTDMKVFQLDGKENVIKVYKLVHAWITSCGDQIDLGWDQDNQAEQYTITIDYDYWETETTRGGGVDAGIASS